MTGRHRIPVPVSAPLCEEFDVSRYLEDAPMQAENLTLKQHGGKGFGVRGKRFCFPSPFA